MIDDSLDAVYSALAEPYRPPPAAPGAAAHSRNPFIAYFLAGKQALLEALVLVQAQGTGAHDQREAAVAELTAAIESVIGTEVDAFGQVCHAGSAPTRHRPSGANGGGNEFAG